MRVATDWALDPPGNEVLAVIATHVVELALPAARAPEDDGLDAAWARAGQLPETLDRVRHELGPILRAWPGRFLFGHCGALRGLDAMTDADNLATLGDPWVNIEQVRHECAYLGLDDWEARLEAMCRAPHPARARAPRRHRRPRRRRLGVGHRGPPNRRRSPTARAGGRRRRAAPRCVRSARSARSPVSSGAIAAPCAVTCLASTHCPRTWPLKSLRSRRRVGGNPL